MQSYVDQQEIPGGVTMLAVGDTVIHLEPVGMADCEQGAPMRADSIFRIASMTKPLTSVAILMLYEEGKLDLYGPVSVFIPEFAEPEVLIGATPLVTQPAKTEITLRHLLTHTSGLTYPAMTELGEIYKKHGIEWGLCRTSVPLEINIRRLARLPLLFEPGTQYQYGMSTDVLGLVVQKASGMPFHQFVEQRICRPLGMKDTHFQLPEEKRSRLVAAYVPEKNGLRKIQTGEILKHDLGIGVCTISADYPCAIDNRYTSGGAGLCSTAPDYMRFCQMLLNGGEFRGVRLLRENTVKLMTTNQVGELKEDADFGLGVGIKHSDESVHTQLRGSWDWGGFWSTQFRISPRGNWILITMTQVAWNDDTPKRFERFEQIVAEAMGDLRSNLPEESDRTMDEADESSDVDPVHEGEDRDPSVGVKRWGTFPRMNLSGIGRGQALFPVLPSCSLPF